ncbi:MAG: molybdopterin-dependent oxidoreductase, partial [Desulfofustis sp.]|nr:molybdopterin-dependent oxidoreductase [Desulfofustis sp.]
MMQTTKKTICPLDCPDSCGLLATVEDGRVVSLAGDPEHPYTNGFICRKMRSYPERLYCPDRILYPQIRIGAKGKGRFKRISWDEAWDHIIPKMQAILEEYGGDAVLPFSYAGNMGAVNRFAGFPLFHRMGAIQPRQTICSAAARGGWKMVCGEAGGSPPSVAADSDLIIAWGINIRVSNVHFWRYIQEARNAGARLLVIDPYENDTARLADTYMQVQPGGDPALALGVLKTLVDNDWLDHDFLARDTEGFEQLATYLRQTDMSRFEQQSGVQRGDMEKLASLLKEHPKTFIRIGVGLTRNSRGGMAIRAIASLAAARGLFDGGTGRGVLLFSGAFTGDSTKLTFDELSLRPGRVVNMIHLGQALTTTAPSVKALIVYNANPVSVVPDGTAVRDGLCRADLFTIVHEQVMSPTARFADILLPATTFLENRDLYSAYGHFYLGVADRAIEPYGEAMSNFDFFQGFAEKMGYTDPPFRQSLEQRIRSYLSSISGAIEGFSAESYQDGSYV